MEIPKHIIEGNKSIAIFLGYTYYPWNHPEIQGTDNPPGWKLSPDASMFSKINAWRKLYDDAYLCRDHQQLNYHRDYNKLMPVVEKIIELGYTFNIMTDSCVVVNKDIIWNCVIGFINYYNSL